MNVEASNRNKGIARSICVRMSTLDAFTRAANLYLSAGEPESALMSIARAQTLCVAMTASLRILFEDDMDTAALLNEELATARDALWTLERAIKENSSDPLIIEIA